MTPLQTRYQCVTLKYIRTVPEYEDNATTIRPSKFKSLLVRAVRSVIYEYEADERGMISLQLDGAEMSRLKREENRQKPIPKRDKYMKGYL